MISLDTAQRYQNESESIIARGETVLIAVSGGLDSVVLTDLTFRSGFDFAIAHCNFQLRGEESERDEAFVIELGTRYAKRVHVKKFDTKAHASQNKCSTQEAARQLRYSWFSELEKEFGYKHTLVAHHADDNIETVLMNFFRGTGIKGMTGIPRTNVYGVHIARPLLSFRRGELLEYAQQNQLKWVEDSSNATSDYTRNLFRNEILPLIKKVFPEADQNVLRNIKRFQDISRSYEIFVNEKKLELSESVPTGEVHVPLKKMLQYRDTSIPFEIFGPYGFTEGQVGEIMGLATSQSGKFVSNDKWQVIRHRNMLVIAQTVENTGMIAIAAEIQNQGFPGGELVFETTKAAGYKIVEDPLVAQLDRSQVSYPLLLRRWKAGDYFYPLGLRKKKKLSRFFIDQKLSKAEKENAWVIESDQRIVWIAGMRIDDRMKITAKTKEVLLIRYLPK
jgi:tRNA(Ile)-lysidine synthase